MAQPVLKKNDGLDREDVKSIKISLLENSIYYFIESVFILAKDGYRLVVIHQNKLLTDETYKKARGARIAFSKFFGYKAWQTGVKPTWTKFYSPDSQWIDKKLPENNATKVFDGQ